MSAETALLQQLSENSTPYSDPLARLDWTALNTDDYWLPEGALSLAGLPEYEALPEATKRRLSHYEFIAFIQSGLWLESIFMERLGRTLRKSRWPGEHAYLLHELREEAGHSLMFLRLIEASGLTVPMDWRDRPWFSDFLGRRAPVYSALFWLAVVVGEEVPDKLNRQVRAARGRPLNPLVREMCTWHIIDEARHIAHSRSALEASLRGTGRWQRRLLTPLLRLLLDQFVQTFYLPPAAAYEAAGLTPGRRWREAARRNPVRQAFVARCVDPTLQFFRGQGFDLRLPPL